MTQKPFDIYQGSDPGSGAKQLPPFIRASKLDDPALYLPDDGLRDAVNVALSLGMPLLLAGEPGTGKTQLAWSLAREFGRPSPLVFHVKTTSTARDLFYRYDSLRHFQDAHVPERKLNPEDYVTYEALGLAILLGMEPAAADPFLPAEWKTQPRPMRSIVLIDELDKAPRDLPNDILNEVEHLQFEVPETGRRFAAEETHRPVLIFTSNSEKTLPDAFLRRCVFYHIPFPGTARLREIVQRRLPPDNAFTPAMTDAAIAHFEELRELDLVKQPATAEFLAWLQVLRARKLDLSNLQPGEAEALALTYSVLAKTKDDVLLMAETIRDDGDE